MRAYDPRRRGRRGLHQLPARPRSAQQQVAQVHLHLIVRLVVEQVEQQRQLAFVLPNSRGRRRAVSTCHKASVTFTRLAVRPAARQAAPASTSGGGAPTRFAALDRRIVQPGSGCYHPLSGRGWKHGRRQTQDEGAEDKLRGVSVRHSCACKGLDQRSSHTHGSRRRRGARAIDARRATKQAANAR